MDQPFRAEDTSIMRTTKGLRIALFGALLLFAGSVTVLTQAAQQAGDQS
jgi:hypothetical protein